MGGCFLLFSLCIRRKPAEEVGGEFNRHTTTNVDVRWIDVRWFLKEGRTCLFLLDAAAASLGNAAWDGGNEKQVRYGVYLL